MRHALTAVFLLILPSLALAEPPEHAPASDGPEQLLERVKDKYPEKYERLVELRESDPRLFHQQMMKLRHHLTKGEQDPEIMERMEEMRTLRSSFQEAVEAYEAAVGNAKEKLREKLTELATEMFAARQGARKRRLERAKERIVELQDEIEQRDQNKDELIQRFVDQATGASLEGL